MPELIKEPTDDISRARNEIIQELAEMEIPTLDEEEVYKLIPPQPVENISRREIAKAICAKFAKPEQRLDESVVRKIVHTALDLDALSKNALIKQYLPQTWIEILKAEEEIVSGVCALAPVSLPSVEIITEEFLYNEWMKAMHGNYPTNNTWEHQNDKAKECWNNYTQAIRNLMGKGKGE